MDETIVWNCPDCDMSDWDTADVIAFLAASHQHCEAVSSEGYRCVRTDSHETHEHLMRCGATSTWVSKKPGLYPMSIPTASV